MEKMIKDMVQALRLAKVSYVVIGGIAASVWGRPRMTLDADIVFLFPLEKLASLLEVLGQHGFQVSLTTRRKLMAMLPAKIKYESRLSVDLRVASYTIDKQALARSRRVTIFGTLLPVASREDIIVYKLARFNDLDKSDIRAILLRWKKRLDSQYIVGACQQLVAETNDPQIKRNLDEFLSWL